MMPSTVVFLVHHIGVGPQWSRVELLPSEERAGHVVHVAGLQHVLVVVHDVTPCGPVDPPEAFSVGCQRGIEGGTAVRWQHNFTKDGISRSVVDGGWQAAASSASIQGLCSSQECNVLTEDCH